MFTETVLAGEQIPAKEMVVVRNGAATQYTGQGVTLGASLGLAPEELAADRPGEVQVFYPLAAEPLGGPSGDVRHRSPHERRVIDTQLGGVWTKLSAAVTALARPTRAGRRTVEVVIDDDDIIVRSTSVWRAFGFVRDAAQQRLWAWTRKTYVIEPMGLDLVVTGNRLQLAFDGDLWPETELVTYLRAHLSP